MTTFALTRSYLTARQRILEREISDYMARSLDKRASAFTEKEWRDVAQMARAELDMVRAALDELPPVSQ